MEMRAGDEFDPSEPSSDASAAPEKVSPQLPGEGVCRADGLPTIRVHGIDFAWDTELGTCTLGRLPVAMMWVDSTLAGLMAGVQAMVGTERFALALQSEGRRSVDSDWQVIARYAEFQDGFQAIAAVAAAAGWGEWAIRSLDGERQECRIRARNTWEGLYQKALGVCWGSAMVAGKFAGYCSRQFAVNCWADQTAFIAKGDAYDEFVIRPSTRSVEQEIERLLASDEATRADMAVALRKLEAEMERRLRMEDALRESEERFRATFEQAAVGMAHVSREGRFLRVNQRFCDIVGYQRGEVLTQNFQDITHPDDLEADLAYIAQLFADEIKTYSVEKRYCRKDGSTVWVNLTASLLRAPDGTADHLVSVMEDISERKRLDEELDRHRHRLEQLVLQRTAELEQARADAEAASRAKGEFLANMSHEIRTPLNAILGMAHMIRRSGATPEQSGRLDKLESAGEHLLDVINAILDLSKIEAGKFELAEVEVKVDRILCNVASFLQERLHAKGIALTVEPFPAHGPLIGDAPRLQQALLNYASNAVKFTESGSVILRARVAEDRGDRLRVRFEVADTGIGVAPEDLRKLFSAFEQADNTDTRKYGGTGLGLAITQKFARLMGGDAGAVSELNVGSTFWFDAQLKKGVIHSLRREATEPRAYEEVLYQEFASRRVLIVEDDPINREIVQFLVDGVGLQSDVAEDGAEAVNLASANHYDAVLMDMQMPTMDGLEATLRLRALPRHDNTPIIALTANAFEEHRQRCLDAGMNDFLTKPVDPDTLYAVLRRWLIPPGYNPHSH